MSTSPQQAFHTVSVHLFSQNQQTERFDPKTLSMMLWNCCIPCCCSKPTIVSRFANSVENSCATSKAERDLTVTTNSDFLDEPCAHVP